MFFRFIRFLLQSSYEGDSSILQQKSNQRDKYMGRIHRPSLMKDTLDPSKNGQGGI